MYIHFEICQRFHLKVSFQLLVILKINSKLTLNDSKYNLNIKRQICIHNSNSSINQRPLGIIRLYLTFLSKLSYSHILIL